MDSMDLEREKGITILAKNTSVRYRGVKLNIVDTPGHADFGGEVERGLTMVDGVLLLVDASEGPLPQTRFVLRKALEAQAAGDPRRQQGRPARRAHRRGRRRGLRAVPRPRRRRGADRVPDRLLQRQGRPGVADRRRAGRPTSARCSTCCSSTSRRPSYDTDHPLQAPRHQPRRLALRRAPGALPRAPRHHPARARPSPGAAPTATIERAQVAELYVTEALDRVEADEARPGEIIAVAGIAEVTIGETLADPDDPRPLPVITVDEPSLSVTIGINTSPLAGQDGDKLTARQIRARLDQELVGNVSLRVQRHRPPGRVGGPGPRRAAARDPRRAHAPRGLRAHRRPAAGAHARDRRPRPRAGRAPGHRRARGLRRRRHPAAGAAQGPPGADGQPRHRLGAHGVPRPGPRPDRLPHRVPHRDARHRPAAPRLRPLGAVGGRAAHAADRRAGLRPPRAHGAVRADEPPGARDAVRRPRRRGLRGHDRRRERARRRPRRQRHAREAPRRTSAPRPPTCSCASSPTARCRSTRRSSSCARTSASR